MAAPRSTSLRALRVLSQQHATTPCLRRGLHITGVNSAQPVNVSDRTSLYATRSLADLQRECSQRKLGASGSQNEVCITLMFRALLPIEPELTASPPYSSLSALPTMTSFNPVLSALPWEESMAALQQSKCFTSSCPLYLGTKGTRLTSLPTIVNLFPPANSTHLAPRRPSMTHPLWILHTYRPWTRLMPLLAPPILAFRSFPMSTPTTTRASPRTLPWSPRYTLCPGAGPISQSAPWPKLLTTPRWISTHSR